MPTWSVTWVVPLQRLAWLAMPIWRRSKAASNQPGPNVEPLRESETAWRDKQIGAAQLLARRYTGESDALPPVDRLDSTISGWLDDDPSRVDINVLVNAVGVAFGQHLAIAGQLDWVIATDEHGSDLALHGQPGDILIYPANATAKRVVAGERDFLRPLFSQLLSDVEQRRKRG